MGTYGFDPLDPILTSPFKIIFECAHSLIHPPGGNPCGFVGVVPTEQRLRSFGLVDN